VLIYQVLGAWRTDFAVSRTPKTVMLFGVFKVAVPLGVHAMFLLKKNSPREFFYVDMPVLQVYLRENLKISAI
jgi:hypothetical protein